MPEGGCGGMACDDPFWEDGACGESCMCGEDGKCFHVGLQQGDKIKSEGGCGGLSPCTNDCECGGACDDTCICYEGECHDFGLQQEDKIKSEGGCGGLPCTADADCGEGCMCDVNSECLWLGQN